MVLKCLLHRKRGAMLRPMHSQSSPGSVLITGASSGLGAALATHYAQQGAVLHVMGRNAERLQSVVLQCQALGAVVHSACLDVRDEDAMQDWIVSQDAKFPIELVIANAGISAGTGESGESIEQARTIFEVNVMGVLNTIAPAINAMSNRKKGSIAIVSSVASYYPIPSAPSYSASKAAVRYYGEALRGYLSSLNISLTMIYPGFIDTPMTQVNMFPMPFMMTADAAAKRISHAIACGKPRVSFPIALGIAIKLLHFLPHRWTEKAFSFFPSKPCVS